MLLLHLICNRWHRSIYPLNEPLGPFKVNGNAATRGGLQQMLMLPSEAIGIHQERNKELTLRSNCWAKHEPHWFAALGMMRVPQRQHGI
jgi:hypothetical protein